MRHICNSRPDSDHFSHRSSFSTVDLMFSRIVSGYRCDMSLVTKVSAIRRSAAGDGDFLASAVAAFPTAVPGRRRAKGDGSYKKRREKRPANRSCMRSGHVTLTQAQSSCLQVIVISVPPVQTSRNPPLWNIGCSTLMKYRPTGQSHPDQSIGTKTGAVAAAGVVRMPLSVWRDRPLGTICNLHYKKPSVRSASSASLHPTAWLPCLKRAATTFLAHLSVMYTAAERCHFIVAMG